MKSIQKSQKCFIWIYYELIIFDFNKHANILNLGNETWNQKTKLFHSKNNSREIKFASMSYKKTLSTSSSRNWQNRNANQGIKRLYLGKFLITSKWSAKGSQAWHTLQWELKGQANVLVWLVGMPSFFSYFIIQQENWFNFKK